MTGQAIALLLIVAVTVGVLSVLLREDLRRAQARIEHRRRIARIIAERPIRVLAEDQWERNLRTFIAEQHISMSILRPGDHMKIVNPV